MKKVCLKLKPVKVFVDSGGSLPACNVRLTFRPVIFNTSLVRVGPEIRMATVWDSQYGSSMSALPAVTALLLGRL